MERSHFSIEAAPENDDTRRDFSGGLAARSA
jgi:hypothetical protein